ncbi:MAG: hypothetical protein KUG53_02475 [Pseudomonadales bacterium]|nr:hypothetical protein [Pseudomonadales bacterium]
MKTSRTHSFVSGCRIFLCIISSLLLLSCDGTRENDSPTLTEDSLSLALQDAIDLSVIPAVDTFHTRTLSLQQEAQQFCDTPTLVNLDSAQQQWRSLSDAWFRLSLYRFGPLDDDVVFPPYTFIDSLRLRGTNYSNTVRSEISAWLAGSMILDTFFFSSQTFQKVGLLALESTLFETTGSHSQLPQEIVDDYIATPRKCEILSGLTANLAQHAQTLHDAWHTPYKGNALSYRDLFLQNKLSDGSDPLATLLTSVQDYFNYLKQRHVLTISSQLSQNAWPSISTSVDEVEQLLRGTEQTRFSFFSLMSSANYGASVDVVKDNLQTLRTSIEFKDVTEFEISAAQLDGNFKREIPEGLEVELGINFTDGD